MDEKREFEVSAQMMGALSPAQLATRPAFPSRSNPLFPLLPFLLAFPVLVRSFLLRSFDYCF